MSFRRRQKRLSIVFRAELTAGKFLKSWRYCPGATRSRATLLTKGLVNTIAYFDELLSETGPDALHLPARLQTRLFSGTPGLEHYLIFLATRVAFGFGYSRRAGLLTIALPIFAAAIEVA